MRASAAPEPFADLVDRTGVGDPPSMLAGDLQCKRADQKQIVFWRCRNRQIRSDLFMKRCSAPRKARELTT